MLLSARWPRGTRLTASPAMAARLPCAGFPSIDRRSPTCAIPSLPARLASPALTQCTSPKAKIISLKVSLIRAATSAGAAPSAASPARSVTLTPATQQRRGRAAERGQQGCSEGKAVADAQMVVHRSPDCRASPSVRSPEQLAAWTHTGLNPEQLLHTATWQSRR